MQKMQNVFVSYRRQDSSDVTGRIFDHLKTRFGEEHLFKDVDSIALGVDFRDAINKAIQGCDAFLAVIGPDWLKAQDATGGRRIDDPGDYVHLEVKSALDRDIPVIPILVDGAKMPGEQDLPEPLRPLALRNAIFVRPDPDFRHDMDRLRENIGHFIEGPDPGWLRLLRRYRRVAIAIAAVIVLVVLALMLTRREPPIPPDVVNRMTIVNVTIIVQEYEKFQGKPIDKELKQQIDQAVAKAMDGKAQESISLLEQISAVAPLPSIFTNLGVEYARLENWKAAESAFKKAIEKDPGYHVARTNQLLLAGAKSRPSKDTNPITFEESAHSAMLTEPLEANQDGVKEIQVVKAGADMSRYKVEYWLKPGEIPLVDPGKYDIIFKSTGGGNFVLAKNIEVKEGQRVRINPNIMLGVLVIEPITRKGIPAIKKMQVFRSGTTGYSTIFQQSDKLGVPLPIVPGSYDIRVETANGDEVTLLKNVDVKEREVTRIKADDELAGFVVPDPKIVALQMEVIRVMRAGTNEIATESKKFDQPMLVPAGNNYDIILEQPSGRKTLKKDVAAKRGELIEIPVK